VREREDPILSLSKTPRKTREVERVISFIIYDSLSRLFNLCRSSLGEPLVFFVFFLLFFTRSLLLLLNPKCSFCVYVQLVSYTQRSHSIARSSGRRRKREKTEK